MSNKETEPGWAPGDQGDEVLDAMLADADDGLLAAIRQGLDLDAGLVQIIGDPPSQEPSPTVSLAKTPPGHQEADDVALAEDSSSIGGRITLMRFRILDLMDDALPPTEMAAVLLKAAASNLKELNRGLEARELNRHDASSLLASADHALGRAIGTQQRPWLSPPEGDESPGIWKRCASLLDSLPGLALMVGGVITSIVIDLLSQAAAARAMADVIIMATALPAAAGMTLGIRKKRASPKEMPGNFQAGIRIRQNGLPIQSYGNEDRRKCLLPLHPERSVAAKIQGLRDELKLLRPGVMKLFDDADYFSNQCAPLS